MNFYEDERKKKILDRDHWMCQWPNCYLSATELAHRIAKTQANCIEVQALWAELFNEKYDIAWVKFNIINHDLNIVASCRKHNDYFNCGNNPEEMKKIIIAIKNFMESENYGI